MSEEKQPKPLTPEQQAKEVQQEQQTDEKQIHGRFAATDMMEKASDLVDGIFGRGPGVSLFGTTNFENAPLNAMLDLLDSANPADLENAGESLEKARTALNEAAKELAASVASIDWKGEGAESFRAYGAELVTYTYGLGTFANAVGAQMKVASTGLTSVRNSKPPRDSRLVQKKPDDFALPERTQDNPEYRKALEVEKDRQEAINQMNRLASFYAVSATTLASEDPPPMPKPVNAAVPRPSGHFDPGRSRADASGAGGMARPAAAEAVVGRAAGGVGEGAPAATENLVRPGQVAGSSPAMTIDSVIAPTAPAPATGPAPQPVQTGPTGPVTGSTPPVLTNLGARPTPARAQGTPGTARAAGGPGKYTAGRPPVTGPGGTAQTGRPGQAVGRSAPTSGPASSTGRSGPAVGRPGITGTPAAGRAGMSGGSTPVTGRAGAPAQGAGGRQSAPGTARPGHSNGIVGGTPQRATNGSTGSTGSRTPRGTVVGGESATTGRSPAARPGQSGVIGAQPAGGSARPTGRGTPSVNGVVGTPRGAVTGTGGTGRPARGETQDQTGSARPDYLTEDEQTWAGRRRGAVPPVID
ncbi:hypothetical protein [Streptomyces lavendofoliae]|uniref:Uncharacterized protein n=1 Tax=Streptomyces lavendofoliae TaxID=67314 RepID=A0A918I3R2_9ACTN|nr:hypothetical protein [Streptomyces lavendofoliae]GGU65002.1 hypothetical protein GCM10010274_62130 [Streptomyces lavendofoliae]